MSTGRRPAARFRQPAREIAMRSLRPWLVAALCGVLAAPVHAQQPSPARAANPGAATLDTVLKALEWRSVGPANMSGRVTDVEGIPSPSRTFYVAAAAGGVWKTTNGGITFKPLFQHERTGSIGDLAIAPGDTLQVWVGTGEEDARNSISPGYGIWKSVDGGESWTHMGLEKTEHIGRIVVHPANPDIVWVAAAGATWRENPERGLYRTTDGGRTWRLLKFIDARTGFIDVVLHPTNPDILFAASWERIRGPYFLQSGGPGSALWKSTDGGETWAEVRGGGFPETMKGRIGIDIARSNPDVIYAIVEAEAPDGEAGGCRAAKAGGCGLYRSDDGGATWRWLQPQNVRPFYYSQVRVDPSDPDHVYWSSTPVNFSRDGGTTVGTATNGVHVDHHALWFDPADPARMIVGNDGGIGISYDAGGSYWFPNSFAIGQFYAVSHDMAVPYSVCGGLQDNYTWCGPSRRSSGTLNNHMWFSISGGDGFVTAQDPRDPCIVYSESQGGNMGRSDICRGERVQLQRPGIQPRYRAWADSIALLQPEPAAEPSLEVQQRLADLRASQVRDSLDDALRWNWNTPFFLSPHDPDVFYAGANRVLKSTSRGDSLRVVSPDLSRRDTMKIRVSTQTTGGITRDATGAETYGTITALAESPLQRGVLAAGTDDGMFWLSRDDGVEWTDLTPRFRRVVPDTSYVSRVEFSPHDANRFYVTFDNHRRGDFRPYVLMTRDGGRSFRSIASNLPTDGPDFVHVIREDPVNPELLYVGTDVGLYVSVDGGASWTRWTNGFPTTPVHDLRVHPRDRELIVATHGRSIWIVDVAPLQQVPRLAAAREPVLLQSPPALRYSSPPVASQIGGEYHGHSWFRGDNRAFGADITYWLPAAADSAAITIRNAAGDTLQTLTGPARAGLNRVTWNLRPRTPPRAEPLTPSERRDSVLTFARIDAVTDSLIAAGNEEQAVRRVAGLMRGETPAGGPAAGGAGAAAAATAGAHQRPWVDRPGEGSATSGGGGFAETQRLMTAFRTAGVPGMPGGQTAGFGGTGTPAVQAGDYTVVVTVGGRTLTGVLRVIGEN
jgi:photosystem II stability/assembly factor-like uncharacterized protein